MKTNPLVSYFKPPITNTRPNASLSLEEVYEHIRNPAYLLVQTLDLWDCETEAAARNYKTNKLPFVTFGGVFSRRNSKNLVQASGLMVLDFDDVQKPAVFKQLFIDNEELDVRLLFVSPSGMGLKAVLGYDEQQTSYSNHFKEVTSKLETWYGLKADKSGKDIGRASFLSHDPDVWMAGGSSAGAGGRGTGTEVMGRGGDGVMGRRG